MKIKKFNEINESIIKNNEKIQKLKKLIMDLYDDAADSISYSVKFDNYWDKNGDELIIRLDTILGDNKSHGNLKEILPQMVSLSNNSRITQETAQNIVDCFDKNELQDFKRWLQLIEQKLK